MASFSYALAGLPLPPVLQLHSVSGCLVHVFPPLPLSGSDQFRQIVVTVWGSGLCSPLPMDEYGWPSTGQGPPASVLQVVNCTTLGGTRPWAQPVWTTVRDSPCSDSSFDTIPVLACPSKPLHLRSAVMGFNVLVGETKVRGILSRQTVVNWLVKATKAKWSGKGLWRSDISAEELRLSQQVLRTPDSYLISYIEARFVRRFIKECIIV